MDPINNKLINWIWKIRLKKLMNKPISKVAAIDGKLWDKGITIAQVRPLEFRDNIEWIVKFKCNIKDNAIIIFKS